VDVLAGLEAGTFTCRNLIDKGTSSEPLLAGSAKTAI
jgi:hypothetical protein